MTITGLALRTYVRYLVPLTLLSAVALGPWLAAALRLPVPRDAAQARLALQLAWLLAATAWIGPLVLAGAAGPLARAIAAGEAPSQLHGLGTGLVHLVRAVVPCLAVLAAIAIGGLALAVPGIVLLGLLALTGASAERGMPGPLRDSVARVRARPAPVAIVVAAAIVVPLAIVYVTQQGLVPVATKKLDPAALASYRQLVRSVVVAIAIGAPIAATMLAAIHTRSHAKPD